MAVVKPDEVATALTIGALLEVSGYPKPGNVHRTRDFPDTRFEHFLASAAAAQPVLEKAARAATEPGRVPVGALLREAVDRSVEVHTGGNTNLGILMLDTLLAPAVVRASSLDPRDVRREAIDIARSTTVTDAVELYRAVRRAGAGGMRRVRGGNAPDVSESDPESVNVTMYEALEAAAHRDAVAKDWTEGLPRTLEAGRRALELMDEWGDVNEVTVRLFLEELAKYPDTLIWRKHGLKVALDVSEAAAAVLEAAGDDPVTDHPALHDLDEELHSKGINPGSTADIVAAALGYAVLLGLRP
ncbi:MAG: hypothetical protein GXO28_03215 [Methanopyri archaeon]|nr:hypothetical protein [Methanopyri archaeon]